ncbi:MAG: FtsX-like permease family protein, partial [Kutzneria sp.]|nr:FtsX-like permease family protein [Kutzneria sp.]
RSRELALLRCVGAHRGQVFRGVLFEAFVIGVIASVVGLGVGVGLAALVQSAAGAATGATGPVLVPVTLGVVFAAFAVGVLVTMASAMMPALRASRVAPLAALRSLFDSHDEIKRTSVARLVFVAALAVTGVGICVLGAHGGATGFVATGIGTMVLLAAAIVLGPVIVGPLVRMLGTLPGLLFGVPAKLAAVNAGRNPKRTAATTAALMIGVTVVTMVTVVATSAKQSVNAEIDKQFSADYTVTSSVPGHRLPTALAGQLGRLDEVDSVRSTAHAVVTLGADDHEIVTATDSGATGLAATVVEGDLGRLSTDTIALSTTVAKGSGAKVGDEVRASSASGGGRLRVVALFDAGADRVGQSLSALVTLDTLARLAPTEAGYDAITVKVKPGVTPEAGQAAVESAVRSVPIADVSSATATKTELGTVVDRLLALVWALVGLAVVIALFGIANTMSLSVLERTGESALLRALGLTRGQLRLMLLVESVLMGLLGAVVGVLLGGGFARLLVVALSSDQFRFAYAVPYGQIAMMLGAAVVAAILAAVLPARKAARSSVVTGMAQV